ncbi:CHAT domain-containing protein [Spirulina subsalsa]|uniref:CHAT domain-containing protein n=1 Tax=Spirulina subsalsa TaxID=54311 RepID=UPI00030E7D90|nr:CHAT domain-containing protein [Spirulina subsalsa]
MNSGNYHREITRILLPWGIATTHFLGVEVVFAQGVVPAMDGTQTQVVQEGQQFLIHGGALSGDGSNLFHSFEQFGLNREQAAQFLTSEGIQNVLGRVVGGNPSLINGLIEVTGSQANLYLMNPAGIIFGPDARLNVPGDFFATTATGIGFEDDAWFNAIGSNDYQALVGTPSVFAFDTPQPAPIINAGDLAVKNGQQLTLMGGTVMNQGRLEAPRGRVNVAAVPGSRLIRLSLPGHLLSLEVEPPRDAEGHILPFSPLDLPSLLTTPAVQEMVTVSEEGVNTGEVFVSGSIQGDAVTFGAVSRVVVLPEAEVRTGRGDVSAPTVTIFPQSPEDPKSFTFLDATVTDYETLLYNGKPGNTTVVVTPQEDGMAKITDTLAEVSGVDELHILAEGNEGYFWLGHAYVTHENIEQYRSQLATWSKSLSPDAQILLYSCFTGLGLAGDLLLGVLAQETGASVAASTTAVGNAELGGNWTLEKQIGTITAQLPFNPALTVDYRGKLEVLTASNVAELITAINTANSNGQDTTINLTPNTTFSLALVDNFSLFDGANGLPRIQNNGSLTIQGFNSIIERNSLLDFRLFYVDTGANLTLNNLTLRNGAATGLLNAGSGGAIINYGTLTVNNSTLTNNLALNQGGAIFNNGGNLTINNSTLDNNTSVVAGGAIFNTTQTVTATNTTISNNTSADGGGLLNNGGNVSLTHSTITQNRSTDLLGLGSGGLTNNIGTTTLRNSIVAENVNNLNAARSDVVGLFNDGGNNLIGISNGTNGFTVSPLVGTPATPLSPQLKPLGNYGGTTRTHVPLPTSPVIQAGANVGVATDQRGNNRGVPDIGAVEVTADLAVSKTVSNPTPQPNDTVTFTVTLTHNGGDDVGGVTLTSLLLPDLEFLSATPSLGAYNPVTGLWTVGTLVPGGSATLTITSRLNPNFVGTTLSQTSDNLMLLGEDPNLGNNQATVALTIPQPPPPPPPPAPTEPPSLPILPPAELPPPSPDLSVYLPVLSPVMLSVESPVNTETDDLVDVNRGEAIRRLVSGPPWDSLRRMPLSLMSELVQHLEERSSSAFLNYFGDVDVPQRPVTLYEMQRSLTQIDNLTGVKPALIYAFFQSTEEPEESTILWQFNDLAFNANREQFITPMTNPRPTDELELVLVTQSGDIVRRRVPGATRERVLGMVQQLQRRVTTPLRGEAVFPPAQQLYDWLIRPLKGDLEERQIENLSFIVDAGLRSLPFAALHDGDRFIIEEYSVGLMPSFFLTDTRYRSIRNASILAMGAAEFDNKANLPGVPLELATIAQQLPRGDVYLNEQFTLAQFKLARSRQPYQILHLATHGDFQPGLPQNSYIQFWDELITLDRIRELQLNHPPVELLVLSSCRTALGDEGAELGFAGLAALSGVRSALGSLWYVSDGGTLALMTQFYSTLRSARIKAEALRASQLSLLRGEVRFENGALVTPHGRYALPPELKQMGARTFTHPYYWSSFTFIGNPW